MASIRNAVFVMMAVCIGLQIAACNSLALSGDKRYKTEINNVLLSAASDFEKNGSVSAVTTKKMETLLTKYEAEYGGKGSYMRVKEMLDLIKEAEANPTGAFNIYRQALQKKTEAEGYLTTEIMD